MLLMKRIMAKSNNQEAAKPFLIQKMVAHKVLDERNKTVSYLNCSPNETPAVGRQLKAGTSTSKHTIPWQ